jgi:polar amino acid transport system permease protein
MSYQWDWRWVYQYGDLLLTGLWWTVLLNMVVLVLGSCLGLILAGARLAKNWVIVWPAVAYIELFRALPVLVLLIWLHYVFPAITGLRFSAFWSAVLALSLNLSAVVADIVRGGVLSIEQGQIEAAYAVGMVPSQVITRIILPIAVRRLMPSLVSQWINVLKLSALASIIGVPELLHSASLAISETYRPLEFYTIVALVFLAIILPATWLSRRLEFKRGLS